MTSHLKGIDMIQRTTLVLLLCLLASGCAFKQRKVMHDLKNPAPVHCATAEGDIRVLKSEKANAAERTAEGLTSIVPAGAALGILTWTEPTKIEVAIGNYNKTITSESR